MQFQSTVKSSFVFLFTILMCLISSEVLAKSAYTPLPDSTEENASERHPNTIPFSSDKSFGEHLLAFPSYLLHWSTRPFGWGIKFAEQKLPNLLQGERGPFGIYPLFELGGDAGSAYGVLMFHNKLTKYNHQARLEALFGSEDFNDFDFKYTIPKFLSDRGRLIINADYANDPIKSLFGGNESGLADERIFATEELSNELQYRHDISSTTAFSLSGRYHRMDIKLSDIDEDEFPPVSESMRGVTSLITLGGTIRFDFVEGVPRTFSGSRYILGFDWNRSLTDSRFHYLQYSLEWHQFLSLPFLPNSRRLAFKTHLQKSAPLGDREIPFYEFPTLGSSQDLRGFSTDRFRDDGSLLLTLEYRYPMWNFADVVLFVDEGQVFSRFKDIGINEFNTSYGFGFHLISTKGFAFRSEFAFSKESSRVILTISPNF